MKKLFTAILAIALTTLGLVATSAAPAQADCGYSSCIRTTTTASSRALLQEGGAVKVRAKVNVPGTGTPVGTMTITVKRKGGGYTKTKSVPYNGSKVKIRFTNIKPAGRYLATAVFNAADGSVYEDSTGTVSFRVIKKKK